MDYPLIESRLITGALAAKYRPGGLLYYATDRWITESRPITTGPRTGFNPSGYIGTNGDGILFCPGRDGPIASLRLENMRDGIEDLAYYHLLRERLGDEAPEAEVPGKVAASLIDYTRDPAVLAAERKELAEMTIRAGQR